jgi:hypothetical protein
MIELILAIAAGILLARFGPHLLVILINVLGSLLVPLCIVIIALLAATGS